jgi:hypothetical protein
MTRRLEEFFLKYSQLHNFSNMKKTFRFILFFMFSMTAANLLNAQAVQDKIYLLNATCFVPQVEGKIGQIQYGSVDSNLLRQPMREFPVGLLGAAENSIKYTVYNGQAITASFRERNGVYSLGPSFAAIDTSDFSLLDTAFIRYLSVTGRTSHAIQHEVFLDGKILKRAIVNSNFKRLVYDFAANDNGLFLFIHEKDSLKVRRLLPKGKELRYWSSGIKSIEEEKEMNRSELIAASEVTGDISSITAFSINNELYVFIHDDGRLYRVSGAGLLSVSSNIEEGRTYKDHSLVEDRDTGRAFLLPKEALKELQKSFNDLIMTYGMEIKME